MGRSRPPFRRLTPAERLLWDAYPTGAWADLRQGRETDSSSGGSWPRSRVVRAEVITALALDRGAGGTASVPGVRLAGARIVGDLDLSDATIETKVHLLDCHLAGTVSLSDARTRGVRLRRCDVLHFRASRATVDGLLDLDGSVVHAGVRLDNAHVTGQLRLSGARLGTPGAMPYRTQAPPWEQGGWTGPEGSKEPRTWESVALWAGGLVVDGSAFLRDLRATGGLRLIGARFSSGLYLEGAVVTAHGAPAVYADHLQAAAAELGAGFTADGTVRLRGARIGGVLSFHGAVLRAPGRVLHLSHMQADEVILLPESIEGEVNLGYSRLGVLFDRPESYPGDVRLNGLAYESLRGPATLADRLSWLRRDPGGYLPQPYEQLAAYCRRIGHEPDARRVLLARQRARRRTLRLPGRLWGRLLDGLVGYGYRPWLAGLWAALLLATGTVVFTRWPPHQIGLDESRRFDAFVYTLDLLVPVSVFEQRGAWEPSGWTQWLANGLVAAGWILATALIAGASRLLRPPSAP
ncbi:oxidoreductase [Microbispora sp. H11081]|uniref:oxidoreductase n=1 Tax=Microbispora sp. H11081 TaxID=2729107 RepID=UPI001476377A|nr:oxidoreductase [Microbispora sp. H11081]